jgi:hypothetical protein
MLLLYPGELYRLLGASSLQAFIAVVVAFIIYLSNIIVFLL